MRKLCGMISAVVAPMGLVACAIEHAGCMSASVVKRRYGMNQANEPERIRMNTRGKGPAVHVPGDETVTVITYT